MGETAKHLTSFTEFLVVLALGVALGMIVRKRWSDEIPRRKFSRLATKIGVFGLLPIHILLSGFVETPVGPSAALLSMLIGAVLCVFCYVLTDMQRGAFWASPELFPKVNYVACTFGGGNRGIVLLTALYLLLGNRLGADKNSLLDALGAIDAGYFLFFVIVGAGYKLRADFPGPPPDRERGSRSFVEKAHAFSKQYWGELFLATSVIVAAFLKHEGGHHIVGITDWRHCLSVAIALTAAFQITVSFKKEIHPEHVYGYIFITYISRIVALVLAVFLVMLAGESIGNRAVVLVPLVMLAFLPPSSQLSGFLDRPGVSQHERDEVSSINGFLNVSFLLTVLLLTVLSLVLSIAQTSW